MKKSIIVTAAALFWVVIISGSFLLAGGFDRLLNKSETIDVIGKDEEFAEILEKIRGNLDDVKSVKSNLRGDTRSGRLQGDLFETEDEVSMEFIFSENKKSISSVDESLGGETGVIIEGNNIYLFYSWLSDLFSGYKSYQGNINPVTSAEWLLGVDGQSMPSPIPDTPGDYLDFNLDYYPNGWDFVRNIEKIEEDLGAEEINGIKCRHYKVKSKKNSPYVDAGLDEYEHYFLTKIVGLAPGEGSLKSSESASTEQLEDGVRFNFQDKEVIIPFPESLAIPVMYRSVDLFGDVRDSSTWYYELGTWAIEGEIWVGEDDFRVYKEAYAVEISSSTYDPNGVKKHEGKWGVPDVDYFSREDVEISYFDFDDNRGIKIPSAEEVVTVEEFLNILGYNSYEAYESERALAKAQARDWDRKNDLRGMVSALNDFSSSQLEQSLVPPFYPTSGNKYEKTSDEFCALQQLVPNYIGALPKDSRDPDYYYTYKSDGFVYTLTARLENLEDEECSIENGVCLYSLSGGVPAPDMEEIIKKRSSCNGSVSIISETCVDNKMEVAVGISTVGECPVSTFIIEYTNGENNLTDEFRQLGDSEYVAIFDDCGGIKKLIASSDGMTIGE